MVANENAYCVYNCAEYYLNQNNRKYEELKRLSEEDTLTNIVNANTYILPGKSKKIGFYGIAYNFDNLRPGNNYSS